MTNYLALGRFNDVDESNFSEEVKNLYSRKDNLEDTYYNINAIRFPYNKIDANYLNFTKMFNTKPQCPEYWKLNNQERLEKGFPTTFEIYTSGKYLFLYTPLLAFGIHQFNKIYSPIGVVLRNQQKISLFQKLSFRLPLASLWFFSLYSLFHYKNQTFIDFKDPMEDELERKLKMLKK